MMKSTRILSLSLCAALLLSACSGAQSKPAASTATPSATPAPAAAPAASEASFGQLLVVVDTVRGNANIPANEAALKVCAPVSKWLHNERVVWRIKVVDPKLGTAMDDKALGAVEVKLSDGQVLQAKYGGHPGKEPTDFFWAVGWTIPESYPSGTAKYAISAEAKDGRKSQTVDFNVAATYMTILDGKVPVIPK